MTPQIRDKHNVMLLHYYPVTGFLHFVHKVGPPMESWFIIHIHCHKPTVVNIKKGKL